MLARRAQEAAHGGSSPHVERQSEQIAPQLASLALTEIGGVLGVVCEQISA